MTAVRTVADDSVHLVGVDVDGRALFSAREKLPLDVELHQADALAPGGRACAPRKGWSDLLEGQELTGIIVNPPWGADVSFNPADLRSLGYELANGQFDSFDLFVELCLSVAPENAALAFILPDAIFSTEHTPLRALLLRTTRLLLIARLGEGFFPGVYRGTTVVVVKKGVAPEEHSVECVRLTKRWRDLVLRKAATLEQAREALGHAVPQSRFSDDPLLRFDIDVKKQDENFLRLLASHSTGRSSWTEWLATGRGVELSKHGRVVSCPHCIHVRPLPQKVEEIVCAACGNVFAFSEAAQLQIILRSEDEEASAPNWQPMIVGEDVDRYRCRPSRRIRLGVLGFKYKNPEVFRHRKLLVRKTGLGIKAAIDESGAYTNQVVFHYYAPKSSRVPSFFLDYLQGVLCSRVMLAYHLKRVGENEWRSHPYVTQKVLSELPVPTDFREGTWRWRQARAIADAAALRRSSACDNGSEEDVQVDRLVAGLYGLKKRDFAWIKDVLDDAESLEPIRTVRLDQVSTVLGPVRVG